MFSHIMIGTNDIEESRVFYDKLFEVLGARPGKMIPSRTGLKRYFYNFKDTSFAISEHGTSTPVGDIAEINAIKEVFSTQNPFLSSTKSLTGHSLGATGAQEVIYSMIMMNEGFISPSINVEDVVEEIGDINLVTKENNENINSFMSNSFGFGGTNACIIFSKD